MALEQRAADAVYQQDGWAFAGGDEVRPVAAYERVVVLHDCHGDMVA